MSYLRAFLLLLTVLLLSSCSQPPRDNLRFAMASNVTTLDPRFATDAASSRINRLIYARLVDFDDRFLAVPSLATWEQISRTHYRFTLGDRHRQFHNGERLTAQDVKATFDFILDEANASPHRGSLKLITAVEAVDENTVDFHLDHADPLFPGYLNIGIVPASLMAVDHPFNREPVGSGPYRFTNWPEEGRLTLTRVADGQELELLSVKDPTVRALKLLRGEVDMLQNDLPPELVAWLEQQEGIQIKRGKGSNFTYLGFNLQDEQTGNLLIRQAISLAIDRQAIIQHVLAGGARPAQALLPPDHWAGAPALPEFHRDLDKAKALLAEAGFGPDNPLKLTYKTSSDPFRVRLATILQSQMAEAGIEVDLRSYDWGTFYGDIKAGRFQMYSLSWVGIKTPDIFRYVFASEAVPPKGANRGRYLSEQTDTLIAEADAAVDLEQKAKGYRAVQKRLLADLPYVPMWYEEHVFVARAGIRGYSLAMDGNYDGLIGVQDTEHQATKVAHATH